MCDIISIEVNAKINLVLDVAARRADGYHQISSVFHSIALLDRLSIRKAPEKSLWSNNPLIPRDDSNLVLKAIKQLELATETKLDCTFTLEKEIPLAAGLGGGSADAAGALILANELFDLKLTQSDLMAIGAKVGADVPFMLIGGAALVEGIGEEITKIVAAPNWGVLLVKPPFGIRTGAAYQLLDTSTIWHPQTLFMIEAIKAKDLKLASLALGNSFQTPIFDTCPSLKVITEELAELGATGIVLSGSGPTIMAITEDNEMGQKLLKKLRDRFKDWYWPENDLDNPIIAKGKNIEPWIYQTCLSRQGWQIK